jgi:DNA-directed RNA polymerase III subunit RPC8
MFELVSLQDTLVVLPKYFEGYELDAIKLEISSKYVGKFIRDLGLFVCIYDFLSIENAFVHTGDGSADFVVEFRMVVFKPFVGGILEGYVRAANKNGVKVSLDFFDEIYVPDYYMLQPSKFVEEQQLWYWKFQGHKLAMKLRSRVRFRVLDLIFNEEISRKPPSSVAQQESVGVTVSDQDTSMNPPPCVIVGSMNESGLGALEWWIPSSENKEIEEIPKQEITKQEKHNIDTIDKDELNRQLPLKENG